MPTGPDAEGIRANQAAGNEPREPRGAIVVLPTVAAGQLGPVAAWVSAAGWASALRRLLGRVWIVTPSGAMTPDELRQRASAGSPASASGPRWQQRIPVLAKTAVKDAREWQRARGFRVDAAGPWQGNDVACVWQRHELFHDAGPRLARALGVPSVVFVPAPLVWQASEWGVHRPGWSGWVERTGERDPLRSADVVACGSEAVAREVRRIGIEPGRIVITPTGADLDLFRAAPDRDATRRRLGLEGRFVVGWVGSFRRFHALEQAVDAVAGLEHATLLLVGDGPERTRVEQLGRDRGVAVRATGTVAHDEIPEHLAAMDVGLVLASGEQAFHYSPLKLAEYLAAGLPVVAPRAGALPAQLHDGIDAVLVTPGDRSELADTLRRLRDDPAARERLGRAARAAAAVGWSWDRSAELVLEAAGAHNEKGSPAQ
jgi:glycosyltransferase involved in cell wall biosynthesis